MQFPGDRVWVVEVVAVGGVNFRPGSRVRSGLSSSVQRPHEETLVDVRTWVHFPRRTPRELRGDVRKEERCKQTSQEHRELNI